VQTGLTSGWNQLFTRLILNGVPDIFGIFLVVWILAVDGRCSPVFGVGGLHMMCVDTQTPILVGIIPSCVGGSLAFEFLPRNRLAL
jgi:hypothetical protein